MLMKNRTIRVFAPPPEPDEAEMIGLPTVNSDGEVFSPGRSGSAMRRRPGIDEEDVPEPELTGWSMPEWDD